MRGGEKINSLKPKTRVLQPLSARVSRKLLFEKLRTSAFPIRNWKISGEMTLSHGKGPTLELAGNNKGHWGENSWSITACTWQLRLTRNYSFCRGGTRGPRSIIGCFFAVWKTQLGKSFATLFAAKDSIIMENKHFRAGTSFVSDFQRERKLSTGHCVFPSLKASGKVTTTS